MDRKELIGIIAETGEVKKNVAGEILEAILGEIAGAEETRLVGFGTFKRVEVKARECRNPATGGKVKAPAYTRLKFKPSKLTRG